MTYWNYRLIATEIIGGGEDSLYVGVHEVYYDGDGEPVAWTEDEVTVGGEDRDEVAKVLRQMLADIDGTPVYVVRDNKLMVIDTEGEEE